MTKSIHDEDMTQSLSPEQVAALRDKGTEQPFTGALLNNKQDGTYVCAACGNVLFDSGTKYESGSGWPSFYDVAHGDAVDLVEDRSHGMYRTEITCKQCGGHLGHVFNDGPQDETGQRYCVNSTSLNFKTEDGTMVRGDGKDSR